MRRRTLIIHYYLIFMIILNIHLNKYIYVAKSLCSPFRSGKKKQNSREVRKLSTIRTIRLRTIKFREIWVCLWKSNKLVENYSGVQGC